MRVIMADSVLSSPTDDHNEKSTYECPLPSCLSTGTLSKLPATYCKLCQTVPKNGSEYNVTDNPEEKP